MKNRNILKLKIVRSFLDLNFFSKISSNFLRKNAIEKEYKVTVRNIRTLRVDGKARQRFTKTGVVKGRTNSYKKALVTLAEGEAIDLYDNI